MKTDSPLGFYLRILIISLLIVLLRLGPTPHAADELLIDAHQALINGDVLSAANNLAGIAQYYPWRYDLNVTAARYAFLAGKPKLVIQYLERPGTVSKLSSEELILLGDAYSQSGNSPIAVAIWKHVSELGTSIIPYERLADYYIEQKDYTTAADYFREQLLLDPSKLGLYLKIGELYAVTNPIKALPFLAQAAEISPSDASQAKALHDKIRTANLFDEPAYTSLMVGRQLGEVGKWDLATVAFRQAITLEPSYADAWAFLGEAIQHVTQQETGAVSKLGLSELTKAVQLDSSSALVNALLALYWERQGDYSQAVLYINHAIDNNAQDPYLCSELGNILSKAGDLPSAQLAFENAIKLSPQDPMFYRQLAQFALDNNIQIRELALPAARQAILLDPQDPISLDLMAQVMLNLFDYKSAERFSKDSLQSNPGYTPAYLHLGMAYLYQGNSTLASFWLSRAETGDPNSWVAGQAARLLEYYFP